MKKILLVKVAFCAILVLTAAGALVIAVARANPVPWSTTPNQEKPTLTVETPQNYSTYSDSSVPVNFTVTTPASWKIYMVIAYVGAIRSVKVYLDGNETNQTQYGMKNFTLNQLAPGVHMLNITVLSSTYYRGPAFNNSHIVSDIFSSSGPVYEYPGVVSDIVYFTVGQPTQNTSPLPSTPESPTWIILPIGIVATVFGAMGVLIYFKKYRH